MSKPKRRTLVERLLKCENALRRCRSDSIGQTGTFADRVRRHVEEALGPSTECGCGDSNCNDCAGAER